jgi:hypothetical protein
MLYPDQRVKAKEQARYPGRIAASERTGDELLAVLAEHSTDVRRSCTDGKVGN